MNTQEYNGWSNYATWKVNLEMVDGIDWSDYIKNGTTFKDYTYLAEYIKDTVDNALDNENLDNQSPTLYNYAQCFLNDVNFNEIAKAVADNYPLIISGKNTQEEVKVSE